MQALWKEKYDEWQKRPKSKNQIPAKPHSHTPKSSLAKTPLQRRVTQLARQLVNKALCKLVNFIKRDTPLSFKNFDETQNRYRSPALIIKMA